MIESQQLGDEGVLREYEYEDGVVVAADFGPSTDASVDVLGDTVVAVVDGEQYDLEVGEGARASIRNGVLTVEVEQ